VRKQIVEEDYLFPVINWCILRRKFKIFPTNKNYFSFRRKIL